MSDSLTTGFSPEQPALSRLEILHQLSDADFQNELLQGVSRTFALTIPLLPSSLSFVVSNAYLLCRTIDTIEDEPALDFNQKKIQCRRFAEVVEGRRDPRAFAEGLFPLLSRGTKVAEQELVACTERVVGITHCLGAKVQQAIGRCIKIMSEGMIQFQKKQDPAGLSTLEEMNRYCYVVAGVVGEMLTDLFCLHSSSTARHQEEMMALATSFGQGLQMTNILKDFWEDQQRGACWLPQDIFSENDFQLQELSQHHRDNRFEKSFVKLIGIAHAHLRNAFKYTLYISPKDKGMRRFCLLALGLAVLTLQKVNANRFFTEGEQVKISRKNVKFTYLVIQMAASKDWMLKPLFARMSRGLPLSDLED